MKKVLIVSYHCKKGKREAFLSAVQSEGIDRASQEEAGNLRYRYFRSIDDPDLLLLLETWKDEDAFQQHCAAAHFQRLGEIKKQFVDQTEMEKFEQD